MRQNVLIQEPACPVSAAPGSLPWSQEGDVPRLGIQSPEAPQPDQMGNWAAKAGGGEGLKGDSGLTISSFWDFFPCL